MVQKTGSTWAKATAKSSGKNEQKEEFGFIYGIDHLGGIISFWLLIHFKRTPLTKNKFENLWFIWVDAVDAK